MHRVEQCIAAHVITSETTNASCCASKTNTHVHADSLHDPLTADALAAGACMSLTSLCNGCENNEHKLNMLAKMLLCILLPQLKKGKFKKGNKMREEDLTRRTAPDDPAQKHVPARSSTTFFFRH